MEEIKHEEQSDDQVMRQNHGNENLSITQKILYYLSVVTVEPVVFFHYLAFAITMVSTNQMIVYKTCREEKYNLTREYCANIEQHTNDTIYDDIENEVVNFNNVRSLTQNFVPVIIAFYIGSWSDKYGRKPFIFLFLAGTFIDLIGTLLSGIFLDEINKYVWLAISLPARSLTGGGKTFTLMVYSFGADNSSPRDRYMRLAIINYMFDLGYLVSVPLGAWLFNTGSYNLVFGTGVGLYVVCILIAIWKLGSFKEKKNRSDLTIKDLISPMNLINSIKTTFKRRPGKKRIYVLCMILLMFINDMPIDGEKDAEFMYVKRAFQWEVDDTSYYETLRSVGSTIGTAVAIPVLHYFNTNDNLIILISTASLVALRFTKWLAKTGDVFLASTAIGALENVFYAPTRSQITRCVSSEELGKVLATMSSFQSLAPIIATAIYTSVYNATSELAYPWASSYLLLSGCLFILSGLLVFAVYASLGFKQIPPVEENDEGSKVES